MPDQNSEFDSPAGEEKRFHGWRLLGVVFGIIVALAVVSAIVDMVVLGPLEGRAF